MYEIYIFDIRNLLMLIIIIFRIETTKNDYFDVLL